MRKTIKECRVKKEDEFWACGYDLRTTLYVITPDFCTEVVFYASSCRASFLYSKGNYLRYKRAMRREYEEESPRYIKRFL